MLLLLPQRPVTCLEHERSLIEWIPSYVTENNGESKDKNYKSPTSDLIKREFDENNNYYVVDMHDEPFNSFAGYWFHL